jgi:uncharacterized surface protein with fasciclin (FAS1) repeats
MIRIFKHRPFALVACVLVLTSSLFTISCSKGYKEYFDDDNTKGGYIFERLQANPEFSSFTKALERANIVQFLSKGGLYTVFAPTNEAFSKFLTNNGYTSIETVPLNRLYDILSYHIVNNMWYYYDFQVRFNQFRQKLFLTRNKKFVEIDVSTANIIKVNGVSSIANLMNLDADNGVIHAIPEVLVPLPNLEETILADAELRNSTFYKLMQLVKDSAYDAINSYDRNRDGIFDSVFYKTYSFLNRVSTTREYRDNTVATSQGGDPLFTTIIIPANSVLDPVLQPELAKVGNDISRLSPSYAKLILESYFVGDSLVTAAQLTARPLPLRSVNDDVLPALPDNVFLRKDIRASNGLIHVINIAFPASSALKTAFGQITTNPEYSTFVAAVQKAGLTNAWANATKTGTFFAPTNQAFIDAQFDMKTWSLGGRPLTNAQVSNLVRHHLINENLTKANLQAAPTPPAVGIIKTSDLGNLQNVSHTLLFKTTAGATTVTTIDGVEANVTFPEIGKGPGNPTVGWVYKIDKLLIPSRL